MHLLARIKIQHSTVISTATASASTAAYGTATDAVKLSVRRRRGQAHVVIHPVLHQIIIAPVVVVANDVAIIAIINVVAIVAVSVRG